MDQAWRKKAAQSISQMVTEWVEGSVRADLDWRNKLEVIIEKRLERLTEDRSDMASRQPIDTDIIRRQVAESGRPFVAAGEVIGAMAAVMEATGGREAVAMFLIGMLKRLEGGELSADEPPAPDHSLTDI